MPERLITLKYAAHCQWCDGALLVGSSAKWNPDTRRMAHVRCPAGAATAAGEQIAVPPPRAVTVEASSSPQPAAVSAQAPGDSRWQQLVDYHLRAVQRAAIAEPVHHVKANEWCVLELGREELVTGRGDELAVSERLAELHAKAVTSEVVYYGWPLVAVTDRRGRLRVAPLLMTELEFPSEDGRELAVAADDAPYLNPGLLTEAFFPLDALDAVDACLVDEMPFGDADGVRSRVVDVLAIVGFDTADIDPDALASGWTKRPGVHNLAMAFRGQSQLATRTLIPELAKLSERDDWQHTAARWLLDPPASTRTDDARAAGAQPEPASVSGLGEGLPPVAVPKLQLNDAQEQAAAAASTQLATVVTGPPGTGKSRLVAAVVVNQWLAGRSVLVASTNNPAVNVAVDYCVAVDPALLVRTGDSKRRDALPTLLEQLAGRDSTHGPSRPVIRRQLEVAAAGREAVHTRLAERSVVEMQLAQLVLDREMQRTMLWGSPDPGPAYGQRARLNRAGAKLEGWRWLRGFRARRLLEVAAPTRAGVRAEDVAAWAAVEIQVEQLVAALTDLGTADPIRDRDELAASAEAWAEAGSTALRDTVQERLRSGHGALEQLAYLRRGARDARVAAVARTLEYLPGWACTALSAQPNFPLKPGLFDLLIVDEASQCSLAAVLPLAYRARRILVVGDPNQLTPIVTLDRSTLDGIARAVGATDAQMRNEQVSVGSDSAFTAYAARSGPAHLLDEHYRCHPEIARFVNEQFYGGTLRVLTDVPKGEGLRGLSFVDVPGHTQRGKTGGAFNRVEAEAVIAWVLEHPAKPGTLGVVTPFAAQADLISDRLLAALGSSAGGITVGSAHKFQGEERDVVLFSTVLAADALRGTVGWLETHRNLVNVAVSRARRALIVFGDQAALAALPVPTLHVLVQRACGNQPQDLTPVLTEREDELHEVADLHSEAERRLYAALTQAGVAASLKPVVQGYELDFAIDTPTGPVDIEVDGTHHTDARGRQRRQDLARDRVLEALGWRVLRVPAWQCLADPAAAATAVGDALRSFAPSA